MPQAPTTRAPIAGDVFLRALAERVERPDDLPAALARARDAVTNEGRQALVNVVCPY